MVERLQENLSIKRDSVNDQLTPEHRESFYATAVIELYSQMFELFCNWAEKFKEDYIKNFKSS
jgi:hypothetical protein